MPRTDWTMADVLRQNARVTHHNGAQAGQDAPGAPIGPRRSKYRNIPQTWHGERFDSGLELERWIELRGREQAGEIRNLCRQVPFPLHVRPGEDQTFLGLYIADFTFEQDGIRYVQDAKGPYQTPLFRWKKKHFQAQYQLRLDLV